MKKRDRFEQRSNYMLFSIVSLKAFPDQQREVVRRILQSPEYHENMICEALLRNKEVSNSLAERFANAQKNLMKVLTRICDEIEEEGDRLVEEASKVVE